jgi:lysophospholipase L1-like esterase
VASFFILSPQCTQAAEFELKNGDRVVLLGNTLVEREQRYGYWEAALTSRFPERVTFRNLGWSGDTVLGIARAEFGSPQDGFKRLKDDVEAFEPTVILVAYGTNESFEGEAGLPRFQQGLDTLLDTLAKTKARMVLISPIRFEDLGKPLPDPTHQNNNLRLYRDVLKAAAGKRSLPFVDLFEASANRVPPGPARPLTENGMHMNAYGYYRTAFALERELGMKAAEWHVTLDAADGSLMTVGTHVEKEDKDPLSFGLTDARLTLPCPAEGIGESPAARTLQIRGLKDGDYTLRIDGRDIRTASARQWAKGIELNQGPDLDRAEQLRETIVAKNREYFHRWRPENDTYLLGFRKHEQGQNKAELPQFDPIVARLEDEITRLRVPTKHKYEITPAK